MSRWGLWEPQQQIIKAPSAEGAKLGEQRHERAQELFLLAVEPFDDRIFIVEGLAVGQVVPFIETFLSESFVLLVCCSYRIPAWRSITDHMIEIAFLQVTLEGAEMQTVIAGTDHER